jgi:V8-like Glu-specific endopeptidase
VLFILNSMINKIAATGLLLSAGSVIASEIEGQPPARLLDRLDIHQSSTCQLVVEDDYTCTGVLLNNTRDQGRPLILTAAHCIEQQESLNSVMVTFGKRKLLQGEPFRGLQWSSRAGIVLLSSSSELDFALLELKGGIPVFVSPVFMGWDQTMSQTQSVSSIHYPNFEDLQYAIGATKPSVATFDGIYGAVASGHWKIDHWIQGTASLGSSGAPLLNSDFEVIGGLSGSTDWKDHRSDYFFRFDLAYDYFGDATQQLRVWIDPESSGKLGQYRPTRKTRNYTFTSRVIETVKLTSGLVITEDFIETENSTINGVYLTLGEKNLDSGATITLTLAQNGMEVYSEETRASELSRYSENYIPFAAAPLVSGEFSVSLSFEFTQAAHYATVPKTAVGNSTSYFLAVNAGMP